MASLGNLQNTFPNLQCSICFETYETPRCLPSCFHSFCERCICSYAASTASEISVSNCACPVCRTSFTTPTTKDAISDWAKTLPLNHVLVSLMDKNRKVVEKQLCEPCSFRIKKSEAVKYCTTCGEAQCRECMSVHRSSRTTMFHDLVDIDGLTKDQKRAIEVENMQCCSVHIGKQLECYCFEHKELICTTCAIITHRKCESVLKITDISDAQEEKIEHLQSDLIKMKTYIEQLRKKVNTKNNTLTDNIYEIKTDIKKVRENVTKVLDRYEKQIVKALEKAQRDNANRMSDLIKTWNKLALAIESSIAVFQTVVKNGTKEQTFVYFHKTNRQKNEYESLLKENEDKINYLEVNQELSKEMNLLLQDKLRVGCVNIIEKRMSYPRLELSTSNVGKASVEEPSESGVSYIGCVEESISRVNKTYTKVKKTSSSNLGYTTHPDDNINTKLIPANLDRTTHTYDNSKTKLILANLDSTCTTHTYDNSKTKLIPANLDSTTHTYDNSKTKLILANLECTTHPDDNIKTKLIPANSESTVHTNDNSETKLISTNYLEDMRRNDEKTHLKQTLRVSENAQDCVNDTHEEWYTLNASLPSQDYANRMNGKEETQNIGTTEDIEVTVDEIGEFKVETPDRRKLWFGGATFLPDGRVVLADTKSNRLIVLDDNFEYQSELPLSAKPIKVACLKKNEIAVTLSKQRHICFYSLSEQPQKKHTMYVNCYPSLIIPLSTNVLLTYTHDEETEGDWSLDTFTIDGSLREVLLNDKSQRQFKKAYYMSLDNTTIGKKQNVRVLQSCQETRALHCFSLNGTPQFRYGIHGPTGVGVDFAGNIYVCNHYKNEIHQLSNNGKQQRVIRPPNLNKPMELCFNTYRDTFLVTQFKSSTIRVFKSLPHNVVSV